jgi:hypothetical protein
MQQKMVHQQQETCNKGQLTKMVLKSIATYSYLIVTINLSSIEIVFR